MTPCFGIDLGTTASAIAVVHNGTPRILEIDGSDLLASAVHFPRSGDPLVGQPALNLLPMEPTRTILSSKRRMGTDHSWDLGDRAVTPVDCAVLILQALVHGAEAQLGIRPERVVITVPAWFTQAQRADTKAAGEAAGLEVARIVNEPTAAALAHAHGHAAQRTVLVYDFGGGTFDASVVRQDGVIVEVAASHGDSLLGGDDIDDALVGRVLERLAASDRGLHGAVEGSAAARVRLRMAVEQAKIELSELVHTTVRVPFLLTLDGEDRHLEVPLHRSDVEEVIGPLLDRTMASVDQVLADAGVSPDDIDELLLVGGATLVPAVWQTLFERYGLEGSHGISPRRAVVLGAALQGAILDGNPTAGILVDVAPYSLSVGAIVDHLGWGQSTYQCRVLTPRNTPLPSRHAEVFYTGHLAQESIDIDVFQGSSSDPRDNGLLARLEMTNLEHAPFGEDSRPIRVTFRHNLDGMVQIDVVDELSGRIVEGQLAADGADQATQRKALLAELVKTGLIPEGDAEPHNDTPKTEHASDAAWAPDEASADEAATTFAAVVAAEEVLEADHTEHADSLLTLARAGQASLEEGAEDIAIDQFHDLSDRLFDLGIFL